MALDYKTEYRRYQRYFSALKPFAENPVARAYFSLVASLFTVAVFAAFAIRPTIATIITLNREIADKKNLSSQLDDKINALTELSSQYQTIKSSLPLVEAALPPDPRLTELLLSLKNLAAASQIKINNVSGRGINYQVVATTSAASFPLTINSTGSYQNLKSFLDQLGNLPRLVSVAKLTISSGSGQLTLKAYYFP